MGYTHYIHTDDCSSVKMIDGYIEALPALMDVGKRYKDILANGMGDEDTNPQINDAGIILNGIGGQSFEPFCFDPRGHRGFSFCKTVRLGYDLPVCEMLLILAAYIPRIRVKSDGFGSSILQLKEKGLPGALDENWPEATANVSELSTVEATWEYGYHGGERTFSHGPAERFTMWSGEVKYPDVIGQYQYVGVGLKRAYVRKDQ